MAYRGGGAGTLTVALFIRMGNNEKTKEEISDASAFRDQIPVQLP